MHFENSQSEFEMNIVIDQGNSFCKVGFYDIRDQLVLVKIVPQLSLDELKTLFGQFKPLKGIISSVKSIDLSVLHFLEENLKQFIAFDSNTSVPLKNTYETPQTLGLDRIAAAVGAWFLKPGHSLLIVDLGTAITYDFVRNDGCYMGGNIAPGLKTRLKSLHAFTERLPMIETAGSYTVVGKSTEQAIRGGVMKGIEFEVEGYIKSLNQLHPDLFAFLTGGDSIFFADKLKNGIFADENLVLFGLNRILRFNDSI